MEGSRKDLETDKVTDRLALNGNSAIILIGCGLILIDVATITNLAKLFRRDLLLSVGIKQGEGLP